MSERIKTINEALNGEGFVTYSLSDLIRFMEREIESDKQNQDWTETRERYQRQIIEQLARLEGLEH